MTSRFSALQRAEIAEMKLFGARARLSVRVSVLFNEPKLLKSWRSSSTRPMLARFSALQRAEIAEMRETRTSTRELAEFQCSSTSRNC